MIIATDSIPRKHKSILITNNCFPVKIIDKTKRISICASIKSSNTEIDPKPLNLNIQGKPSKLQLDKSKSHCILKMLDNKTQRNHKKKSLCGFRRNNNHDTANTIPSKKSGIEKTLVLNKKMKHIKIPLLKENSHSIFAINRISKSTDELPNVTTRNSFSLNCLRSSVQSITTKIELDLKKKKAKHSKPCKLFNNHDFRKNFMLN